MSVLQKIISYIKSKSLKFRKQGKNLQIIGFPIFILNKNVYIGNNVQLYPNVTFFGEGDIFIGNHVKIGNNVVINASKGSFVRILDKSIIAANTYIIDSNHNIDKNKPIQEQGISFSPVIIGEDCWIGASCVIGKGAEILNGAVIGANSFVNSIIPEYSIAVGTPAKVTKTRL